MMKANLAHEEAIREEITNLETDRDQTAQTAPIDSNLDSVFNQGEPQRENSQVVARYEPDSRTVGVHNKMLGTDSHAVVDSASTAGTDVSRGNLEDSLSAAKNLTAQILGGSAKMYPAQTQSGTYKGTIIAETDHHFLQRLSAQTAIAHPKESLESTLQIGQSVAIAYVNESARVKQIQERAKSRELAR
jgi:hypothetical protein